MKRVLGYCPEELIGRSAFDYIHPDNLKEAQSIFTKVLSEPGIHPPFEFWIPHKDGSRRCLEVVINNLLEDPSVRSIIVNQHDITERKRAEEAQRFLNEASTTLSSSLDYRQTLASVARLAVSYLADWCAIDILDKDGSLKRLAVEHEDPQKVQLAHELQKRYPDDPDAPDGIPQVARSSEPEFYPEITDEMLISDTRDAEHLRLMREIGFTSVIIVPLVARGRTLGVITLVTAESGRRYREADLEVAEELARRAAIAVDNARLYEEAQKEISEREKIQQELRSSRDQLDIILQEAADGITVLDPTGRLIYANEAAARIIRYPSTEALLEAPLQEVMQKFEIMDESGQPFPLDRLPERLALQGLPIPQETLLYVREIQTGEEWWTIVKATPVFDHEGQVRFAVTIFQDVTERRRAEETHARLAAIVQSSDDAIIGKTVEGIITSWNQGAQKIYGYSAEEVVGKPINILVSANRPDEIPNISQRIKRGEAIDHYETKRITKDGRVLDVSLTISPIRDSSGSIVGASTIARDITERKQAEEARARQARQAALRADVSSALSGSGTLQTILQQCTEAMVEHLDAAFARIWILNEEEDMLELQGSAGMYTRIDGTHSRVAVGRLKIGLIAQERRPHLSNTVISDARVSYKEWAKRKGMVAFAGYPLIVEERLVGVVAMFAHKELADDTVEALGSIATSIAQGIKRKRVEEEIKRLNEQLERRVQQRTAQLTEANKELESFSYSVSHDLKAPLRHINGFAEMLKRKVAPTLDEASLRYLKNILQSAERAQILIEDLLSFSRMGRAEMRRSIVDMDQLLRNSIQNLEPDAHRRDIDWQIGELPEVWAEPSMLGLVWQNLLSNALKYTRSREQATIAIGSRLEEDEAIFFVQDNGVGFDMRYVDKLYGVFQRLHEEEEFEGTGIGLANVRRIVQRHGGRSWAEGEVGSGATFYFTLPLLNREEF